MSARANPMFILNKNSVRPACQARYTRCADAVGKILEAHSTTVYYYYAELTMYVLIYELTHPINLLCAGPHSIHSFLSKCRLRQLKAICDASSDC